MWRQIDLIIPVLSISFCLVSGIVAYRNLPASLRLLVFQAGASLLFDALGIVSIVVHQTQNNQALFNCYLPVDFLLTLFAVRSFFARRFRIYAATAILCFAVSFLLSLSSGGIHRLATQTIMVYALVLAIMYFLVLLKNTQLPSTRHTTGIYCIAILVMLYYCGTIPYFGFMHQISEQDMKLASRLSNINNALSSLRYIFTGIGFILLHRSTPPVIHAYK